MTEKAGLLGVARLNALERVCERYNSEYTAAIRRLASRFSEAEPVTCQNCPELEAASIALWKRIMFVEEGE